MELKKASITDIIDLKKICIDAYSLNFHHHWNAGGLEWYLEREFSMERLTSDLADKYTEYYFIIHELKTVGFIKTKDHSIKDVPIEDSVEVEKIYVLPACKGMGIGKLALQEISRKTEERAKKNLFLCVIDTNQSAIAFYEKLGFKFHSKTTLDIPYFKEDLNGMHRMVKELKGQNPIANRANNGSLKKQP
jgi:ribosomal protein S18 acetylase RimI-like enzyme